MHTYQATIHWERGDQAFADNRYSRAHTWRFDGGAEVAASSSPTIVPLPMSNPAAVDPEEALVAATSSCHMLFFLSIAGKLGFTVDRYLDPASGEMAKNDQGKIAMTRITLRPQISFGGERQPSADELARIHHDAHERCFIASSLKTEVVVEG
jgi:organic hydroperoxide reductase OsmC/OhrA